MNARKPKPAPLIETISRRNPAGVLEPVASRAIPEPGRFASGNKAASKGEPRTHTLTVRIPASTDAEIRRRSKWEGVSRADVIIAAVSFSPG